MGKSEREHHLQVSEIFKSIQGEGQLQGELTTFIRLTGCNLRCPWCDTAYAYEGGADRSVDEITSEVEALGISNVCVTGGEPLIQPNVQHLFDALRRLGCFVCVETNGTRDIGTYQRVDRFVVDYKLPSARPAEPFLAVNFDRLRPADELKFVISDRADYEEARRIVGRNGVMARMLVSPCWQAGVVRDLAGWLIEDNLPVRYSLQIHKAIWGEEAGR